MANVAAQLFKQFLDSKQVRSEVRGEEEQIIRTGWDLDGTKIDVYFFFGDDCTDVQIRGVNFIRFTPEQKEKLYTVVNACNDRYRWVKFVIDEEDNDIYAQSDAIIQLDSCAEECYQCMMRVLHIVEEAYPVFMKAIWS